MCIRDSPGEDIVINLLIFVAIQMFIFRRLYGGSDCLAYILCAIDTWEHSYTRQKAAYPIESVRENKFWVNVARVDNTLGCLLYTSRCV